MSAEPERKASKPAAHSRAAPIIEALHELAREFARREDGRKKLERFTGLKPAGLDTLLYQSKGSPTTWLNVFLCVFGLDATEVKESLIDFATLMRRRKSVDPTDKRWFEISKKMDRDTKDYWLSIIEHAQRLKKS